MSRVRVLSTTREMRDVMEEAEKYGWTFEKSKRHVLGRHPLGLSATLSVSSSDKRALDVARTHLWLTKSRLELLKAGRVSRDR